MAKLDVPAVSIAAARNVPMEMRDGTVLRADIYRTAAADSQPVLLIRNPYGFPCYDRNPGNGAPAATATPADFTVAEQTVFLDAGRPSYITLPVIPR